MTGPLNNGLSVIDSREIIERIDELEAIDGIEDKINGLVEDDDAKELVSLRELQSEAEGYAPDWKYGCALVRDSYFVDYARELLEDCGDLPKDLPHYIAIDWNETAKNIQVDYTSVEFDGVTYWVR